MTCRPIKKAHIKAREILRNEADPWSAAVTKAQRNAADEPLSAAC